MDSDHWLSLILVFLLLLVSGWFAACETALSSASPTRIRLLAEKGKTGALRAGRLLEHYDSTLSALLIGNNLAHIMASTITTLWAARRFGNAYTAAATLVLTLVVFFFAELLPKSLAKKYAVSFSCACSGLLSLFCFLCTPFSFLLSHFGQWGARLAGKGEAAVTEDEFHDMVESMAEESALDDEKGELVQSALDFGDRTAGDIITARVDMTAVSDSASPEEILYTVKTVRLSRLPVYHGSVDNIVGVLSCRGYIRSWLQHREKTDLRSLMDSPFFVPAGMPIDSLLAELNRRKQNLAIVVDDYGGVAGLVTMEDILEELVGEIWDEDDVATEKLHPEGSGFLIDANMAALDCLEQLNYPIPAEEEEELTHKTMGSLALSCLERIPSEGDAFTFAGADFIVHKMRRQRIVTLFTPGKEGSEA